MIINLLSSPRNISTALMYSFAAREDMKVLDEPLYGCYLKESKANHPGASEIISHMECNYEKVFNQIENLNKENNGLTIFVKNMSHHFPEKYFSQLLNYSNVFLIREPSEMINSFSKVIAKPTMIDIGIKAQYDQFIFLQQNGEYPIVVDSNQIAQKPEIVLPKLCERLQIHYTERMLSWESGSKTFDGVWAKHWYANVHLSTGFQKKNKTTLALHPDLIPLYKESLPYYIAMLNNSIKDTNHATEI